jgi:hypothetical protein
MDELREENARLRADIAKFKNNFVLAGIVFSFCRCPLVQAR